MAGHGRLFRCGDAHHVADDPEGKRAATSVTKSQAPLACTSSTMPAVGPTYVVFKLLQHPRGEAGRYDPAQPGVAWIVDVDHRAEELEELHGHVRDADGARCPTGRCRGGGWPRPRRRAGSGRNSRGPAVSSRLRDPVRGKRDGPLVAQGLECPLAGCRRERPELTIRQVDLINAELLRRIHGSIMPAAHPPWGAPPLSFPAPG